MKQIVICCNDYPQEILPIGATEEQAELRVKELAETKNKIYDGYLKPILYFHYHEVPIYDCKGINCEAKQM